MTSRYSFTEYSPDWPVEFALEAERVRELIGPTVLAIHHIGSTSVPGLAAKPIIDLLPVVRDMGDVDVRVPVLEVAGYKAWGEYGIAGRRLFTKDRDAYRTHNIHVFPIDSPEIDRHLAFCAYLRCHELVRDEYAALKRDVFARHPADINGYMDEKNAWIKSHEPVAITWYRDSIR